MCMHAKLIQSCPTLCDPRDCSLPGSSVHGILQERIMEWVAMPSSRGSSPPKDRTHISYISCNGRRVLYHCATWEALAKHTSDKELLSKIYKELLKLTNKKINNLI